MNNQIQKNNSQRLIIAFCFNNEESARLIGSHLKTIAPEVLFIFTHNFDEFVKIIAKAEKVDAFIIEETYKGHNVLEFAEKIKKSHRYKKSAIGIFTLSLEKFNNEHLKLCSDFVFDIKTNLNTMAAQLKNLIQKKHEPAIPPQYNILVLDDDESMLEIIYEYLKELGHTVEQITLCHNVQSAKKALTQGEYQLLLLDWNLPDGSCLDILGFIKNTDGQLKHHKSTSVIITGRDSVEDIMTLLQYGVKDHIIKPFQFDEFEEKISYAIQRSKKH